MNPLRVSREARIRAAQDGIFDIGIIGGGIHGAALAREAALHGYRIVLFDSRDYGFGTSSRSSKMIHGGVRYLEHGDLRLVRESLLEREILLNSAPHLTRTQQFLLPVIPGKTRPFWQLRIGLTLYDLLGHRWGNRQAPRLFPPFSVVPISSPEAKNLEIQGLQFTHLLCYSDGQMDDSRLTVENILDATILGGITLNYARVEQVAKSGTTWTLRVRLSLEDELLESRCRFLINASGPWLPTLETTIDQFSKTHAEFVYSQGTHLLFSVPWKGPGLVLPTPVRGRFYFVWPYFSPLGQATLVGTTDRIVSGNILQGEPTLDELKELLTYLKRDLPYSQLNTSTLYYTFSGVRILGTKGGSRLRAAVSDVSRRIRWYEQERYLSFVGGKFTSARHTAELGISRVSRQFRRTQTTTSYQTSATRKLPGGEGFSLGTKKETTALLSQVISSHSPGVDRKIAERHAEIAVARFGIRAKELVTLKCEPVAISNNSQALRSEVQLSILEEQALTVEDVLRRRLGIALEPGGGRELLPVLIDELSLIAGRKRTELAQEAEDYTKSLLALEKLFSLCKD